MSAPFSVRESTVSLFGVGVVVHHLNTGERVIEEASMLALFEAMAEPGAPDIDPDALRVIFG